MAGSATAPAARCRKRLRWESFIDAIPGSRYAIQPTSAWRWSREARLGTARPAQVRYRRHSGKHLLVVSFPSLAHLHLLRSLLACSHRAVNEQPSKLDL